MALWQNGALLRKREGGHASVSFVELFFDLVYVFAVMQISHYLLEHLTWTGALQSLILWFAVWLVWQYNAWVTNWFDPETMPIRLMQFTLMLISLVMASSIGTSFTNSGWIFAACIILMQVGRSLFVLLSLNKDHHLSLNYRRITVWGCLSAVFWIAGALMDSEMRLTLWALAVLCDYIGPMLGFYTPGLGRSRSADWNIDGAHMAERCQLFTIVALGETILIMGASLTHHDHWDIPTMIAFVISFLGTLSMWWIYFDTSSKDGQKAISTSSNPGRIGAYFNYVHVVMLAGVILVAVASELVIAHPAERITMTTALALLAGPTIYLAGNLFYKKVVYNRWLKSHLIGIALLGALLPAAFLTDLLMVQGLAIVILITIALTEGCTKRQTSFCKDHAHER